MGDSGVCPSTSPGLIRGWMVRSLDRAQAAVDIYREICTTTGSNWGGSISGRANLLVMIKKPRMSFSYFFLRLEEAVVALALKRCFFVTFDEERRGGGGGGGGDVDTVEDEDDGEERSRRAAVLAAAGGGGGGGGSE